MKYTSLVGHENSVTTAVGYQLSHTGDIYIASGSADSTVKIWRIADTTGVLIRLSKSLLNSFLLSTVTCLHTLDLKNGFAITLELIPLDNHPDGISLLLKKKNSSNIVNFVLVFLLFVATDKNKVQLYQVTNSGVSTLRCRILKNTLEFRFSI